MAGGPNCLVTVTRTTEKQTSTHPWSFVLWEGWRNARERALDASVQYQQQHMEPWMALPLTPAPLRPALSDTRAIQSKDVHARMHRHKAKLMQDSFPQACPSP